MRGNAAEVGLVGPHSAGSFLSNLGGTGQNQGSSRRAALPMFSMQFRR